MSPPPGGPPRENPRDAAPWCVAVTLSLTLLVLVPAHVYLVNRSAVLVFLREVLAATMVLAGAASLLLYGLLRALPPAPRVRVTVFLLGVAVLCWIHAYCLVWPYDVMDGGDIHWADYTGRSLVDASLWLVVLTPLLGTAPRIYRWAGRLCLALVVIQLLSFGVSAIRAFDSPLDFFKHYYVEKAPVFKFSTRRNVIVIVLDEFQSDIFAQAVLPRARYRRLFPGFTYFPDTVAGFNFTEYAIPALLTGRIYDNAVPRVDFLRTAYLDHSVPAMLKRAGFAVHLFPWRGFANESIYYDEAVATNFKRRPEPVADQLVDVARLVDLGLFRSMPQFAKPWVYANGNWRLSGLFSSWLAARRPSRPPDAAANAPEEIGASFTLDDIFLGFALGAKRPELKITVQTEEPVFKFYHLAGLHVPVKLKRDFTAGTFDYNRANFGEAAEAWARIMGAFLAALGRHGCYDNSLIVIAGDHGSGRSKDMYVQPGSSAHAAELDRTASRLDFQRDKARGLPLLLIKPFGASGDIKTSTVPASLADLPATLLGELGLPSPGGPGLAGHPAFVGTSLFSLQPDQPRTRYYGAMRWSPEKSDYANPITLYRIQGPATSDDSWSFDQILKPGK